MILTGNVDVSLKAYENNLTDRRKANTCFWCARFNLLILETLSVWMLQICIVSSNSFALHIFSRCKEMHQANPEHKKKKEWKEIGRSLDIREMEFGLMECRFHSNQWGLPRLSRCLLRARHPPLRNMCASLCQDDSHVFNLPSYQSRMLRNGQV